MPLLVTSASGANGNGFGALLAFELDGSFRGTFLDDDRVTDPRGLAVDPNENLLFLNSGADRVLAISAQGRVVRDTGWIDGLNPGGGNFGPDGGISLGCAAPAPSSRWRPVLIYPQNGCCRQESYLFLEDLLSVMMGACSSPQESVRAARATTR